MKTEIYTLIYVIFGLMTMITEHLYIAVHMLYILYYHHFSFRYDSTEHKSHLCHPSMIKMKLPVFPATVYIHGYLFPYSSRFPRRGKYMHLPLCLILCLLTHLITFSLHFYFFYLLIVYHD